MFAEDATDGVVSLHDAPLEHMHPGQDEMGFGGIRVLRQCALHALFDVVQCAGLDLQFGDKQPLGQIGAGQLRGVDQLAACLVDVSAFEPQVGEAQLYRELVGCVLIQGDHDRESVGR